MLNKEDNYKHKGMRKVLVQHLIDKGIKNKQVLSAIDKVPRHFFFETAFTEKAYQDIAFPIGEGQTISQPYTVAFQTELLDIRKDDKVLEIGTGSGYQSCVLLDLGANLFTIEFNKILFERTKKLLPTMGYYPKFFCGDGTKGLISYAPYDKIIVTAGGPIVPESLLNQLKIGGILIIPVGDENSQRMLKITKMEADKYNEQDFGNFSFVKLLGKEGW